MFKIEYTDGYLFLKIQHYYFSRPSILSEVSSPINKSNLERRLTVKSQELSEYKEKNQVLASQEDSLKNEIDQLKIDIRERDDKLQKVEAERDVLDRDMAKYISEIAVSLNCP